MSKKTGKTYEATLAYEDDKRVTVAVYSNRDAIRLTKEGLTKDRLHPGVDPTNEDEVKTAIVKLYRPKIISLRKCF